MAHLSLLFTMLQPLRQTPAAGSQRSFLCLRLLSSLSSVMANENIMRLKAALYLSKEAQVIYFLIFKLPTRLKDS